MFCAETTEQINPNNSEKYTFFILSIYYFTTNKSNFTNAKIQNYYELQKRNISLTLPSTHIVALFIYISTK